MNSSFFKYIVRPALGILTVVLLLVLLLHTSWGLNVVAQAVLSRLSIFPHANLSVTQVEGRPFSRLSLEGIKLTSTDDSTLVEIESAQVGYQLLPMLKGEFHLTDLVIARPRVKMTQQNDLSWDLLAIVDADTTNTADTTVTPIVLTLNQLVIKDGSVEASTYSEKRDSTYQITNLSIQLGEISLKESFSGKVDQLQGQLWTPYTDAPVDLSVAGAYDGQSIQLDSLSLQSAKSHVEGRGRIFLSTSDTLLYQNELTLIAAPLSFDDIRLFLPSLAPGHYANIDLSIDHRDQKLLTSAKISLSDGADITAEGSWTRSETEEGKISVSGRVLNFDPAMLTGSSSINALVNADVSAALSGKTVKELSGSSIINIYDSQLAGLALDTTSVEGTFKNGRVELSLVSGLHGADLSIAGSINPFDDTPDYNFEGQVSRFNIAPFVDDKFSTHLNALISLNGRGFDPDQSHAELSVQLDKSRINTFDVNKGALTAQFDHRVLSHTLSLSGAKGDLSSDGVITLNKTTSLEHLNLSMQDLDIAALLGESLLSDSLQASITGRALVAGQIDPLGKINGTLKTDIDRAQFMQFDLQNASISGTWKEQQIVVNSAGLIQTGAYNIEGMIRFEDELIAYEITKGTFDHLDIGTFLEDSNQASDLNGSIFLVGSGFDPATMSLSGQLELLPSQLNQQKIIGATTWFAIQSDTLNFDLKMELPIGSTSLVGRAASFNEVPSYRISKGEFQGIDLGKIAGLEGVSSNLNGAFTLTGRGTEIATMDTRGQLALEPSFFNDVPIEAGETSFNISNNAASLQTAFQFEEGTFSFDGSSSSLDNVPAYQFNGVLDNVDIAGLMGADSTQSRVNLAASGNGRDFNLKHMSLKGRLTGTQSSYQDVRVDTLDLNFNLEEGMLMVDTLLAVSNVARFSGSGPIALFDQLGDRASSFSMQTRLLNLAPLEGLLPVGSLRATGGELETRIFGRQGALRMDTRAKASGFVYDTYHVGDMDIRITGEFDKDRTLSNANITGQVLAVSIPGFLFEEINLEALLDSTEIRFSSDGRLDKDRGMQLAGSFFFEPEGQRLRLDRVNLSLDEDKWQLAQPANIEIGTRYRVDNFAINSGNQHIALNGLIDFEGNQDMQLDIRNFGVGTVADLLGFTGLDGPITSHIDIQGPADAPIIEGTLDMQLITFEREIGDLSIIVAYDSLQLNMDASLAHKGVNGAHLYGALPIDLSLATPEESTTGAGISQNVSMEGGVDFSIDADSMAIDWILSFIDPTLLDVLEGTLTAHIKVGGTAEDPTLEGTGRLVDGKLRSPAVGVTYEDFKSDIALRDNNIELTNVQMRSGEGIVSGSGSIELSDLTSTILNIDVTASQFLAISTKEYRATASGNLDLTGSLTSPVLKGNVTVLSADMYLYESSSSELADLNVQLTDEDLLMLEREFGIRASAADTTTFDFLDAMSMDLQILLERDVWIRSRKNPEMNIQFSGDLEVTKAPFQEYMAFGNIDLIPDRSYINQFGKRFDITLGNLLFNGPATDPQLDFEALYEVPARRSQENAVTIYLDAKGQLEKLDLTLRAEPTMELTDILSYIATGQPASEALQLGGTGTLASTGAGFALNQGVGLLTGAIEGLIQGSGLELDVIQIEPQANAKGATITAGKYVTPRIFTSVSQPIGASDTGGTSTREGTVITLELELIDSLLLRLLGGESVLQFNLLWHHAY